MSEERSLSCPEGYYREVADVIEGREYPVEMLPEAFTPTLIVDVGANVGAAALYFSSKFPEAEIHCVEPSGDNLQYLLKNVEKLPKVEVHPVALHAIEAGLPLYDRTGNGGGHSLLTAGLDQPKPLGVVKVRPASAFFAERKWMNISILKLDAEGSEPAILMDLFSQIEGLVVLFIFVEYHSRMHKEMIIRLLVPDYEVRHVKIHGEDQGSMLFSNREFLKVLSSMTAN